MAVEGGLPDASQSSGQAAIGRGRFGGNAPEIASSPSHTSSTASSHASKSCCAPARGDGGGVKVGVKVG